MRISKEPALIRQIIMDHYEFPRNKGLKNTKEYIKKNLNSEACIDNIDLEVKIEGQVIEDIRFDGVACTISTASTSILTEMMKGKTFTEANKIIDNYVSMLHGEEFDEELLEEAVAFINTSKQANRIKCATLAWDGLKEIIAKAGESNE
ncbi:TPA: SUF system NifU family Fe-S cluster assembly protein [bacterium]|mgnify:CR=1 FL=1|nr:SUF system NifU family Fe-S cluster assembly protein [bacterium]